ncbi:hypothetical protein, variant [Aphanomyces astaci]|uniref:Uncharacterized protein n=1 Tax=Aphanomyces astaci TaxID=112090 RepID=W4G313_APHAT|nr:hypothetical protein, variant [Aphanomyces astaci]ETV74082.1 hypothetical protein, variant [Aphanomyces astaci]|eukprot:XP_009836594.1 hypothetical protein, variant [Aphanomyces astaci]
MAMQDALISPITKPTKKPPPPSTAKPPQRIKAKKLSRKKRLQNLERQVYDLEGVLTRAQRSRTTLLPWEEIALAFKEDTLNQVRDHRSLKRQLQRQEHVNLVLQTWVTAMLLPPPQRTLNPHADTWRHSHLIQGDDDIRRTAQLWIMQHSYHNTDRAMSRHSFPDSMESLVEVNVAVDDDGGGGLFRVDCMVQYTVDLPLQEASDVYWLAENSFTSYRQDAPTFFEDRHAVQHAALRYDRQVMSVHMAKQNIRSHSLHGQFRTPSRTTVVCRTILHDEAFPEEDAAAWVLDAHLWYSKE